MNRRIISVTAAGKGERMRTSLSGQSDAAATPKPLLQTGAGETLLGRIVRQAAAAADVEVYANYDSIRRIGEEPDLPRDVRLLVNRNIEGPLGALYLNLERTRERSYMAAGDFWADFDWLEFERFHETQPTPVSILVGRSVEVADGAVFEVGDDGVVRSWRRVERTRNGDLINIGAYIVDPVEPVLDCIRRIDTHKEDQFNDAMIAEGLMSAYVVDGLAFNVNDSETYAAMIAHTGAEQRV